MTSELPANHLIFGQSEAMQQVQEKVMRAAGAGVDAPVLIHGESGTGKEILARLIHKLSLQVDKPFVKVHCPAIPPALLETELFGYEKGAFTGADRSKPGRIEQADGGTLFLDEIAELTPSLQAKLLHILQESEVCRVGGQDSRQVKVRIICATNRDLEREISEGRFREDLYYRINVVNIEVPALRDRRIDMPILVGHFLDKFRAKYNRAAPALSEHSMELLAAHHWPGNIRELENIINRYVILNSEAFLASEFARRNPSWAPLEARSGEPISLKKISRAAGLEAQKQVILNILRVTSGNRREAARALNISYRALLYKLKDAGIGRKRAMQSKAAPTMQHVN